MKESHQGGSDLPCHQSGAPQVRWVRFLRVVLPWCQNAGRILRYEQAELRLVWRGQRGHHWITVAMHRTSAERQPYIHPLLLKHLQWRSCCPAKDSTQLFRPWHGQQSCSAPKICLSARAEPAVCCASTLPTSSLMNLSQSFFEKQIHTCHTRAQLLTLGKKQQTFKYRTARLGEKGELCWCILTSLISQLLCLHWMKQNKQPFHMEGKISLQTKVCKVSYVGLFEFCSRKIKEIPQLKI